MKHKHGGASVLPGIPIPGLDRESGRKEEWERGRLGEGEKVRLGERETRRWRSRERLVTPSPSHPLMLRPPPARS